MYILCNIVTCKNTNNLYVRTSSICMSVDACAFLFACVASVGNPFSILLYFIRMEFPLIPFSLAVFFILEYLAQGGDALIHELIDTEKHTDKNKTKKKT